MEAEASRPIAELFDLMVGTSVGGLTVLAMATPDTEGGPGHSAASLTDFFTDRRQQVFPSAANAAGSGAPNKRAQVARVMRTVAAALGLSPGLGNARYPSGGYENALHEYFGNTLLSEALTPVVVTAYDARAQEPVYFRSADAVSHSELDAEMATVARAGTAAPTYFPPHAMTWAGKDRVFFDGGVFANSASLVAFIEARRHALAGDLDPDNLILVSLGSGRQVEPSTETRQRLARKNWYQLSTTLLKGIEVGQQDTHERLLEDLLGDGYRRFQPSLPNGALFATDDARDAGLKRLANLAEEAVQAHGSELEKLVAELTSR